MNPSTLHHIPNPAFPTVDPVLNGLTHSDIDVSTSQTPHVLMFVIHGMGRQSWLGRNIANLRATLASLTTDPRLSSGIRNVLSIPIEYHSKLHAKTHVKVDSIKLSTCSALRTVINDFAVDPLYYYTPEHGGFVRNEVTRQLNSLYTAFRAAHPHFTGEVTVLAHSMGGLIMWDILNQSDALKNELPPATDALILPIRRVFCMGSPISNALVLRGHEPHMYTQRVPFMNLHHPHDPVAYRFEPLFDPVWKHVPSVVVDQYVPVPDDTSWGTGSSWPLHRRFVAALPNFTVPGVQLPPISDLPNVVSSGMRSLVASVMRSVPDVPDLWDSAAPANDDGYDSDNEWDPSLNTPCAEAQVIQSETTDPYYPASPESPNSSDSRTDPRPASLYSPTTPTTDALPHKRRRLNPASVSVINKTQPHRPSSPEQPDVTTAATLWAMFMGVYASSSPSTSPPIPANATHTAMTRKRKRPPPVCTNEGDAAMSAFAHLITSDRRHSLTPTLPSNGTSLDHRISAPMLSSLPFGFRLDYVLQVSGGSMSSRIRHVDLASEYLSGLRAHFDYWASRDAMWFVLCALNGIGPAGMVIVDNRVAGEPEANNPS